MTTTPDQIPAQQDSDEPAGRPAAPAATPAGAGDTPTGPLPPRNAPRWVRWTVVPLLFLVPLVYVLISAEQSRDGGVDKQQEAAIKHLIWEVPSQLLRRVYQVPIPDGTVGDGYLETNSWDHSEFYVQFTTSAGGLDTFLAQVGTSRTALVAGKVAISAGQAKAAGWDFSIDHPWSGISLHKIGDRPDHDITVDLKDPDAPTVYVVSTVNFQHGFGGG